MGHQIRGHRNPRWNDGRRAGGFGARYITLLTPDHPSAQKNGYVYEHRLVAERMLGRLLEKNEVIHHVNGNPRDNRPGNLLALTGTEHNRLHGKAHNNFGSYNTRKKRA